MCNSQIIRAYQNKVLKKTPRSSWHLTTSPGKSIGAGHRYNKSKHNCWTTVSVCLRDVSATKRVQRSERLSGLRAFSLSDFTLMPSDLFMHFSVQHLCDSHRPLGALSTMQMRYARLMALPQQSGGNHRTGLMRKPTSTFPVQCMKILSF